MRAFLWVMLMLVSFYSIIFMALNARAEFPTQPFDNFVREHARWQNVDVADAASDILHAGLAFAPLAVGIGHGHSFQRVGGMVAAQTVTMGLTHGVKVWSKRVRPNGSNDRSFFSGHTSSAFVGAAALCELEKQYCVPGYLAAAGTGYFRIAADKHWASDVIVGAVVGSAAGHLIPSLVWSW